MILSARIFVASTLILASTFRQALAADCSHVATSVGDTSDCCNCACGHEQCAIYKRLGEDLQCLTDNIYCYSPDGEDEEGKEEAAKEDEWVEGDWKGEFIESEMEVIEPTGTATGTAPELLQCSDVAISVGSTEDCCQCACGSDQCAVFKKFGEDLVCDPLKVHCYSPDDNESFDDAEGEWYETIQENQDNFSGFADCLDVPIPSASQTEDCCMCACGTKECAVFKTAGTELTCDASTIHCYEEEEEEDNNVAAAAVKAECSDVPIPSATETEDCCMCACGNTQCAIFKTPGAELICDASTVHCYEEEEEADDIATAAVAKCFNVPIPSATETDDCCMCACGNTQCAIFKSPGAELICDASTVHCYEEDEDDSADELSSDWWYEQQDEGDGTALDTGSSAAADANALPEGTAPILADCSDVDVDFADTSDCCSCACGHTDCAIFHGPEGQPLTCNVLKVHCYNSGEDDDDAVADDGEWITDWAEEYTEEAMQILQALGESSASGSGSLFQSVMIINAVLAMFLAIAAVWSIL